MSDSQELEQHFLDLAKKKAEAKQAQQRADALKKEAKEFELWLHDVARERGVRGLKTDTHTFSIRQTIYGHVQDEEAFKEWAAENGEDDAYFVPRQARGRINELVREHIENGWELPPGLGFYPDNQISTTEN